MMRNYCYLAAGAGLATFLCASPASAQPPPPLNNAQSYAVLAGTAVTVAGTGSVLTGDVGVSPGTAITGIPAGGLSFPLYDALE